MESLQNIKMTAWADTKVRSYNVGVEGNLFQIKIAGKAFERGVS